MAEQTVNGLIQIGVVDDHPVFRQGLRRSFEREDDLAVAWEIGATSELLPAMAERPVDILLMDLNLGPGEDSLAAIRTTLDRYPELKVVVISASLDSGGPASARGAGAHGYMPKDLSVAELSAGWPPATRPSSSSSISFRSDSSWANRPRRQPELDQAAARGACRAAPCSNQSRDRRAAWNLSHDREQARPAGPSKTAGKDPGPGDRSHQR